MRKIQYINAYGQSLTISDSWPFVLEDIRGTESPSIRLLTQQQYQQDGIDLYGTLLNPRYIDVSIAIKGDDQAQVDERRNELIDLFSGRCGIGLLKYTNEMGTYQIGAQVYDGPVDGAPLPGYKGQRINIGFYCPKPAWESTLLTTKKMVGFTGGLTLPLTLPLKLADQGDILDINYAGTLDAPLLIEFRGPATMPKIWNQDDETIEVELSLAEGESLFINTLPNDVDIYKVINNVQINANNYVKFGNNYFQLIKGLNTLQFSSASGDPEVYISWRTQMIGI